MSRTTPEEGSPPEAPGPDPDLRGQVVSGARWSLANNLVIRVGTFASGVVLARLLAPEEYGVYAIALVALTVLLSLNELGVSLAVVRWDRDPAQFVGTVTVIAVVASTVLYAACWAGAPLLAAAMDSPGSVPVVRVLCLSILIDAAVSVPNGLIQRGFRQRLRLVVDILNFTVGTVLTLVLAAYGFGPMSLAIGRVAGNLVATAVMYAQPDLRFRPAWDPSVARELLRFGLPLAASSLLVLAMLNLDYIVVGARLGPEQLGLYLLAFNVASWPVAFFSEAARRVAFAGLSRIANDDDAVVRGFGAGLGVLLAVTVPVCVQVAVSAAPFVSFVYGRTWVPAAAALAPLALLGIVRVFAELSYDALVARERARAVVGLQLVWLSVLVPSLLIGSRVAGIAGVGWAHVVAAALVVVPAFVWQLSVAGVVDRRLVAFVWRPLVGGLVMAAASLAATRSLSGTTWQFVLVAGLAGLAVYLPFVVGMRHLLRTPARADQVTKA